MKARNIADCWRGRLVVLASALLLVSAACATRAGRDSRVEKVGQEPSASAPVDALATGSKCTVSLFDCSTVSASYAHIHNNHGQGQSACTSNGKNSQFSSSWQTPAQLKTLCDNALKSPTCTYSQSPNQDGDPASYLAVVGFQQQTGWDSQNGCTSVKGVAIAITATSKGAVKTMYPVKYP